MQEFTAHGLPCPAFKEDIIRHHDAAAAVLHQQGFDMLDKVELLIGGGGPEVLPLDNFRLLGGLAVFADNGGAALLAERGIGFDLIGKENWSVMSSDVKGDAYEGLLEKNAQDTKSGAGQYFTPRPLIQAMVVVVRPKPGETICDPACGTGGFLLAAHEYIIANNPNMTKEEKHALKDTTFSGWELVQNTARLCAMNLMMSGVFCHQRQL